MQRRSLRFDSNVAAPDSAFLQQASGHKLRGVDPDGEAQTLRAHDGRRVHADDLTIRRHQRPTGISRVQRTFGLDQIIDQSSR